jgi:type IV pilus assembly protein PilB
MPVDDSIQRIIMSGGNATDIADAAAEQGVWDLRKSALDKVKNGITSLDEVNRVTTE